MMLERREILKSFGTGLLVLLAGDESLGAQESGGARRKPSGNSAPQNVAAWIHIDAAGKITAFTGKTEVGQNIRTSLTQAIADELPIDPAAIMLVMADTALTPYDFGTVGSRTTPAMAPQLRAMAASAREQMFDIAAQRWGIDRGGLKASNGMVFGPEGAQKATYAELAKGVDWVKVLGRKDCLTPVEKRPCSGKSLAKIQAIEFVTGRHRYTSDIKRPGMVYGRVLRAPSFEAKLIRLETSAAEKLPGVQVIRDGDFAGVTAKDEYAAQQAVEALQAQWKEQPQISNDALYEYLKANPEERDESRKVEEGGARNHSAAPNDSNERAYAASYQIAYIAHVPLEPRASVAEWNGNQLTVWTGTQRPFGVRSELAEAFQLPETDVRVIVPDTGSAYGGKHTGECAIEAARLAKGAGKSVKLIWTREEEFTWAYFRPAGVIDVEGSVTKSGEISKWSFVNYNSGPSGLESPYKATESSVHFQPTKYPLRQGSYRGLAATANHFARESHIDELAALAGLDPLEFRLKNLQNERVAAVLKAAAERFEWAKVKKQPGRGFGMACGLEKGSFFATCTELSFTADKQIRVERVVEAFECGAVINPEHLKNQVEGAIVMGIGGALFEEIHFANGRIQNPHLAQYRVPRFSDVPAIDVVLVDRKDMPSMGAGETPIMGIAAAIANAVFQGTGVRVRSMPILPAFQKAAV
jgi:CO/xanthine dehydrogenase Mo-binding subunit